MCLIASAISVVLQWVEKRSCSADSKNVNLMEQLNLIPFLWSSWMGFWAIERAHDTAPMIPTLVDYFPKVRCHGATLYSYILDRHASTRTIRRAKKCFEEFSICVTCWSKLSSWLYLASCSTEILNWSRLDLKNFRDSSVSSVWYRAAAVSQNTLRRLKITSDIFFNLLSNCLEVFLHFRLKKSLKKYTGA